MADFRNDEAYDLSLFEPHKLPQVPDKKNKKTASKPEVLKEKPKTRAQRKAEAANRRDTLIKAVVVGSVLFGLILNNINSQVTITKNAGIQAEQEVVLAAAQSEGVRLNAKLDATYSLDKVEKYAIKAGMRKVEGCQIFRITVDPLKGDEVINYIGKPVN
ncbi:MAG: hypothetical protein WCN92_11525 [Eubacteriales bacterium]